MFTRNKVEIFAQFKTKWFMSIVSPEDRNIFLCFIDHLGAREMGLEKKRDVRALAGKGARI